MGLLLSVKGFDKLDHAVGARSHMARCSASHCSAWPNRSGTSSQVRTRPCLRLRTTPLRSSTARCFISEGKAISKGSAKVDTVRGPCPSAATIAHRVGSASAWNTS